LATLTAADTEPQPALLSSRVAVLGDAQARKRVEALLRESQFDVVASGASILALVDGSAVGFEAAVLVGGADLLSRGGAVEIMRASRPGCAVVVVSQTEEQSLVRKAVRGGVDGFVAQAEVDDALEVTLAAVLAGQISVPHTVRDRISWASVSLRERQVLQLVATGLTNAEIADQLYLSESTVKSHLSKSFRKLSVSSRAEAAAVVLDPEHGLGPASGPASPLDELEHELLGTASA
jgi:DNA-binding NarL/FixJ family response regulator